MIGDLLTRELVEVLWNRHITADSEEHTVEHIVGNFEIPFLLDMTHIEHTFLIRAAFLQEGLVLIGFLSSRSFSLLTISLRIFLYLSRIFRHVRPSGSLGLLKEIGLFGRLCQRRSRK